MKPVLHSVVLLSATFSSLCAGATPRSNVLFILCDDIRWNAMSCAGHPAMKTPNIDRFANDRMPIDGGIRTELPDQKIR
jgi:hypothetical protein